jgi:hypothetical protein
LELLEQSSVDRPLGAVCEARRFVRGHDQGAVGSRSTLSGIRRTSKPPAQECLHC